jgi:hypothetical protein
VLIDELTGKRVNVTVPAGCFLAEQDAFGDTTTPLGGSWLVEAAS